MNQAGGDGQLFNKGRSIILIAAALIIAFVCQSHAANVIDVRHNSEVDKTRVVVELDGPAQYQAIYTSEPGVSICLLETGLKSIGKTINIGDERVKTMVLKEMMGHIVEVSISLEGKSIFRVFPLQTPDRIVIDVTSDVAMKAAQPLNVSAANSATEIEKPPGTLEHAMAGASGQPLDSSPEKLQDLTTLFSLKNMGYAPVQLCFNVFMIMALIVIGIKLWRVTKVSKKNLSTLKKGMDLADIMGRLQQGTAEKNNSLEPQRVRPLKTAISGKTQKRKRRKERPQAMHEKQYEKVHKLAQLGMDRMEISQQSNVPIGEVNLILDLSKSGSQAEVN